MLNNFKIKNEFFSSGFLWSEIPQFAVITGINGSGKTKLLEAIRYKLVNEDKKEENKDFFYLPYNYNPNLFSQSIKEEDLRNEENRIRETLINWNKEWKKNKAKKSETKRSNSELYRIVKEIEEKSSKFLEDLMEEEINNYLVQFPIEKVQENISNNKVGESFIRFNKIKNEITLKFFSQANTNETKEETCNLINKELIRIFGTIVPPWELLNEKFSQYNFPHKIKEPTNFGNYEPKFVTQDKNSIVFSQLSSGEKAIVQLILWSYSLENKGNHNKLLIMDEFDAHLNPSMAKMYIEIIKEVLIEKFSMQVIITTHSPSSIAYCEDENLFWMEKGCISKVSKKSIISKLSNGLMLFDDTIDLISCIIHSTKNKILFVEGKSDKIYIEKSIKALSFINLQDVDIIPCCGASTINTIIDFCKQIIKDFDKKKIVVLVDNDPAGRRNCKVNDKLIINLLEIHNYEFLDKEQLFYPIEFLFDYTILSQALTLKENPNPHNLIKAENIDKKEQFRKKIINEGNQILLQVLKDDENKVDFANRLQIDKEIFKNFENLLNDIETKFNKS